MAGIASSLTQFIIQPWSLFTYMFMHAGFLHILFNMLWLYWFGALFLMFFSAKHLRGAYILGGICGGLLYMAAFNIFPYFRPMVDYSFMLGASASVLAIVAATAYREPNYPHPAVPLWYDTVEISGIDCHRYGFTVHYIQQCGRTYCHLGGALAGLWFAAGLSKGKDITAWINKILDAIVSLFSFKPRKTEDESSLW